MGRSKASRSEIAAASDREVADLIRSHPTWSYQEVDRHLGRYTGYSRHHAQQYMRRTGESLFDDDDIYGRTNLTKVTRNNSKQGQLSEEDRKVAELYKSGMSLRQIEDELGTYNGYAMYHFRRYTKITGEKPVRGNGEPPVAANKPDSEGRSKIIDLLMEGRDIVAVAETVGVSRYYVYKTLREEGLTQVYLDKVKEQKKAQDDAIRQQAMELRSNGMGLVAISRELHITTDRLRTLLADLIDLPVRQYTELSPTEKSIILLCYAAGDMIKDLSEAFKASQLTIRNYIKTSAADHIDRLKSLLKAQVQPEDAVTVVGLQGLDRELFLERCAERAGSIPLRTLSDDEARRAENLYMSGQDHHEIAKELGVSLRDVIRTIDGIDPSAAAKAGLSIQS